MKIIAPGRIKVASGSKDADGILMKSLSFQHGHHTHLSGIPQHGRTTWLCQLAVALTQASVVVGSVYLKGSLRHVDESKGEVFHPIVYAFAREACAAPILFAISVMVSGYSVPVRKDAVKVFFLGFCMFLAQLLYIMGIEISGVLIASCIQPTIPVFTAMLGILLKMESAHPQKILGILLAVLGAICMVSGSVPASSHHPTSGQLGSSSSSSSSTTQVYMGNFYLTINAMAMAAYYILAKKLVARYSPIQVAAWAYMVAASLMGCAALLFTSHSDWNFPHAMVLPLLYWIFICSVGGYFVVTWAMKHLPASQVAAFQCLQPFLGTLLAFLVLQEQLSWWDLGAVGVVAGLLLVSVDSKYEIVSLRRVSSYARSMGLLFSASGSHERAPPRPM